MTLLTPLFLLGLIGIGLPIWLHRLQTQTTEREKFSSTMFLEPSQQRIHVQRKLKYLLLMALRILFILFLIFAFARPVFFVDPQAAITSGTTHHVIVVDTSFSMREGDSFNQAISEARQVINDMGGDDIASLYSASSTVTTVHEPTDEAATLEDALGSLAPDNGRLDIGAMISALDTLIEPSQANFIIHFIGDYQQTGQAQRFADMVPDIINGRPVALATHPVKTETVANWAVSEVSVVEQGVVRIGITHYGADSASEEKTVTLSINGAEQQSLDRELSAAPGGVAYVQISDVVFADGDNRIDVAISPNDSLAEDDRRHAVFDNSPPAPVLLLSASPQSLAVTYITAALETAPRGYQVDLVSMAELDPRILQRYSWVVIDDIGAVTPSLEPAFTQYVTDGGAILAAVGNRSESLGALPVGGHTLTSGINLSRNRDFSVERVDNTHPALDSSVGWNNLIISRALPIETTAADGILISLASDTPLLLERRIGQGRFMLFNTNLDNTWSDIPVKPVFVSFMAEAARYLSNEELLVKEQTVNSFLQLGQGGGLSGQVFDPQGNRLLSLEDTTRAQNIRLGQTGYYRIVTAVGEDLIAVNPDPRESDLELMSPQALQNWQALVAGDRASVAAQDANAATARSEAPDEFEIWRVLLAILAIVVILETILSNRYLSFRPGSV